MTETGKARFPWRNYLLFLMAIVVFALWPVASMMFTYVVAEANGCVVNEGSINPCIVLGMDVGGLLYATGVMGWFMLATVPFGFAALLIWAVTLIIHRLSFGQKQKGNS